MPLIERLQVSFFNQLTYFISHLQQFMSTAENLRLNTATLTFLLDHLTVMAYPHKGARNILSSFPSAADVSIGR